MTNYKLNNGNTIPSLGFGTFLITNKDEVDSTIKDAVKVGYRLIDTAAVYENEEMIGNTLNELFLKNDINRSDLVISSKLLATKNGRDVVKEEYRKSLKKLKLDYLDLYLIHWMPRDYEVLLDSWRGFEDLYLEGKVKNIGICNVSLYYLDRLIKDARVMPMLIQVELHPFLQQDILLQYCKEKDIKVMAYGPFAKLKVFENEELKKLSIKYNKPIASLILKWGEQKDLVMLSKTTHIERMKTNFDLDFNLSDDDMQTIKNINDGLRVYRDPENNPYTK